MENEERYKEKNIHNGSR